MYKHVAHFGILTPTWFDFNSQLPIKKKNTFGAHTWGTQIILLYPLMFKDYQIKSFPLYWFLNKGKEHPI
jgi:hypothetical protein